MPHAIPYDDAILLLEEDHQQVKTLFLEYAALSIRDVPPEAKEQLVGRLCDALSVHARIEEEIFYPAVRGVIRDDELMDHALDEHAWIAESVANLTTMAGDDPALDEAVRSLGRRVDEHVLEEREQVFLRAQRSPVDLRALAVPLMKRRSELRDQRGVLLRTARSAASVASEAYAEGFVGAGASA